MIGVILASGLPRAWPAVVSLVGHHDTRRDVRTGIKGGFELRRVAHLATGQVEIERIALEVGLNPHFSPNQVHRASE
jgi:hypothetical protein